MFDTFAPKIQQLLTYAAQGDIVRTTDGNTVLYMMLESDHTVMRTIADRQGITFEHQVLSIPNHPDIHLCKGAQMDDIRAIVLAG